MKIAAYQTNILRIIDVNINRALEGLRVCEDTARFLLDDRRATDILKALRHKVQKIRQTGSADWSLIYGARDVKADVGKDFCDLEAQDDWQGVFLANMQRVKEALRVLEEFFKLFDANTAKRCKALRFEVYETEKTLISRSQALSHIRSCQRTKPINR